MRCRHSTHTLLSRGCWGSPGQGQQQFATQTLRVHLLGIDTPLLRAMGFLVSQHGQLGAIPPPPFLSVSPLESMRSGGAIPPPEKGCLGDTCAIPHENQAKGCDTPLCDTILKGYCAIWGGISRWAAKLLRFCGGSALECEN